VDTRSAARLQSISAAFRELALGLAPAREVALDDLALAARAQQRTPSFVDRGGPVGERFFACGYRVRGHGEQPTATRREAFGEYPADGSWRFLDRALRDRESRAGRAAACA
jgi:hypothetical protein